MKRYSFMSLAVTLTLILSLIATPLTPVKASPGIIIVPDTYSTIQEAVNNANDYDVIQVRPGTYNEVNITVTKPLTVEGIENGSIILQGPGTGTGFGIYIHNTHDVTIRNLTIQGYGSGIFLHNSHNCIITNNISQNNAISSNIDGCGVRVEGSDNNTITGNAVLNNEQGIYLWKASHNDISGNAISSNDIYGIELYGLSTDNNTISANDIYDNVMSGVSVYMHPQHTVITGNNIYDNHQYGIRLYQNAGYTKVYYNDVMNNSRYGIWVWGAHYSQIYNNNFINNLGPDNIWGKQAYSVSNPTIVFNLDEDIGGNYWSDWTEPDSNEDGFVDSPYTIPIMPVHWGTDHFPWTIPYGWLGSPNQPPVADADGPYSSTENFPIDFNASGSSDPDGDSLQFRWDFDSDGTWDTDWSPFFIATYMWCDDFSGTATVEVTDGQLSDTDTSSVEVTNLPPIIDVLKAKPESVQCYLEEIEFTGIGKDPGCDDLAVEWDFGDGTIVPESYFAKFNSVVTHTYDGYGDYTVTLTVTDDDGGVASKQIEISIWDTTPPKLTGECIENVNPHRNNIPGEDRGKNGKPKNNKNPDGFYLLDFIAEDDCDPEPQIWIGTADNPMMFLIEPGIVVKFTESADAESEMKKIGSANGQADAVTWHIILPSDPVISAVDASGNIVSCGECLVPPPPM